MFRRLGDWIYRIPWWGLLAGGVAVLIALALFAVPIHVLRLSDHGRTPEERKAIEREINLAFGDRALDIAQSVVGSIRARATDPERRRELDQALAEMARARNELSAARAGTSAAVESANQSAESAIEAAANAAESALESATEARQALEEARDDALARLRDQGLDTRKTALSFDELLIAAKERERAAKESQKALARLQRERLLAPPPAAAAPPPAVPPAKDITPASPEARTPQLAPAVPDAAPPALGPDPTIRERRRGSRMSIDLDLPKSAATQLPLDVRNDIRKKVAGDVWRVGIGSGLILLFIPIFIMLVIAKYYIGRSRRALAFAEEKKREAEVSDVNRQITEARLQALQAQVEPHFLYNTLANVQALTEADPPAANAMVGHLIQYLRAALPKMRENTSTIGQEVELVTAYLNVLKMRMGARLEFGIDMPPELAANPFPPLMLPSLVENAIKHGLEPVRDGGRIDVVVRRVSTPEGDRIHVQVIDTGRGLSDTAPTPGGGVGLANLRERLGAIYGGRATFTLVSNEPRGVVATIDVPAGAGAMNVPPARPTASPAVPEFDARSGSTATSAGAGWRTRAWQATRSTHSVWAYLASRIFLGLMMILAIVFLFMLAGLYTGWLPLDIEGFQLDGIEGMALGSIVLLVGFAVCALVIAIVVAVFYGLGFVLAVLLLLIPVIILVSLFPVLAPFVVIGLIVYLLWRRRKRAMQLADAGSPPGSLR